MPKPDFPRIAVPPSLRSKVLQSAREFRHKPTKSEAILWEALRGKQLDGVKFRRQQPIGPFIADFYSSEYRLVVEIDGPIHDFHRKVDRARQEFLEKIGLTVMHLKAEMIETNLPAALNMISAAIRDARAPSPLVGEGRGGGK